MKKLGVFGGSFNPIHLGHIILAGDIAEEFNLEKILFIPAYTPPLKSENELLPYEMRYKMVESAIADYSNFDISDIEKRLPQPSYTINTLRALRDKFPAMEFHLIIGSDQAAQFGQWKEYDKIEKIAKIVVMSRNKAKIKNINMIFYNKRRIDISSTEIRRRIKNNLPFRRFLPETVYKIIKNEKLFG